MARKNGDRIAAIRPPWRMFSRLMGTKGQPCRLG
jgi:hypothetical protein